MDCIFCKIINGEIPSTKIFEDETSLAFRDINPVAPTHILLVPKAHFGSLAELSEKDEALAGHLLLVAARLARQEGLEERGYRVLANTGAEGCQSVEHLHLHIIGGRQLKWEN